MKYIIILFLVWNIYADDILIEEIKEIPSDIKLFYSSDNLKLNKDTYKVGAEIAATTLILMSLDEDIREIVQKNKSETLNDISPLFRKFGEFYPPLFLVGVGYISDNEKNIKTGIYAAEASLLGLGITYVGKNIFTRARPYTDDGSNSWGNDLFEDKYSSFPSAHSTISFATATVIAEMYKDKKGISELSYTLATLAALSRVYDDKHWASDIFLGSCIGYFSGKVLIKIKENNDLIVVPIGAENNYGIGVIGKF